MNKNQFLEIQEDTFKDIRLLTVTKGDEYSNSADQLANFKRAAERLGLTKYQILNVYLHKHLDAIDHFCATGELLSDSMASRVNDAILFLILFKAMVLEDPLAVSESFSGRHPDPGAGEEHYQNRSKYD